MKVETEGQGYLNEKGEKFVRQFYTTKKGKQKIRWAKMVQCAWCQADFVPTRRGVQKFCSTSCRSQACKKRNHYEYKQYLPGIKKTEDKFSLHRLGENLLANAATETAKYFAHDRPLMQEIKKLTQKVDELQNPPNTSLQSPPVRFEYIGVRQNGNVYVALFRDLQQKMVVMNDASGIWYRFDKITNAFIPIEKPKFQLEF